MKTVIFILVAALVVGCTNKEDANRALNAQGFTNIEILGYDFFGCSKDDFYHTKFSADNISGIRVTGTVCSGFMFKNATIRY